MKLLLYGVSRDTVSKEDQHHYFLNNEKAKKQLDELSHLDGVSELVILYNEFRTEYYFVVNENNFEHGEFIRYLSDVAEKSIEEIILETYSKFNLDCIRHVYHLLSGVEANCESSEELVNTAEKALRLVQSYCKNNAPFLTSLFQKIIGFISHIKTLSTFELLFPTEKDVVIQHLRDNLDNLKNKRYFLVGNEAEVIELSKVLYRNNVKHITLFTESADKSMEIAKDLQNWMIETHSGKNEKVFYAFQDWNSYYYYFSSADAILISLPHVNEVQEAPLDFNKIYEEVKKMRPNKKKQLLILMNGTEELQIKVTEAQHFVYEEKIPYNKFLTSDKIEAVKMRFDEEASLEAQKDFEAYRIYEKSLS